MPERSDCPRFYNCLLKESASTSERYQERYKDSSSYEVNHSWGNYAIACRIRGDVTAESRLLKKQGICRGRKLFRVPYFTKVSVRIVYLTQ